MEVFRSACFHVNGIPKGQPRPRAFKRGNKAAVYDPGTAEGWKGSIALEAQQFLPDSPITDPVKVEIQYRLPRPQRLNRNKDPHGLIYHTAKPDIDNMNKAVLDCLTSIGFFQDDKIVVEIEARKFYHEKNGRPGATIYITRKESIAV